MESAFMLTGRPSISAEQFAKLLAAFLAGAPSATAALQIGCHRNPAINYYSRFRAKFLTAVINDAEKSLVIALKEAKINANVVRRDLRKTEHVCRELRSELDSLDKIVAELEKQCEA
jgi:hypothetical protein